MWGKRILKRDKKQRKKEVKKGERRGKREENRENMELIMGGWMQAPNKRMREFRIPVEYIPLHRAKKKGLV